jgi:TM2 domain-containing membrane protein YozV
MKQTNIFLDEANLQQALQQLNSQERALIQQRIELTKATPWLAIVLWFFVGLLGAHRWYLKRPKAGWMTILFLVGWATMIFAIGDLLITVLWFWWLYDLFCIPKWLRANRVHQSYMAVQTVTGRTVDEINSMMPNNDHIKVSNPIDAEFTTVNEEQPAEKVNPAGPDNNDFTDFSHPH